MCRKVLQEHPLAQREGDYDRKGDLCFTWLKVRRQEARINDIKKNYFFLRYHWLGFESIKLYSETLIKLYKKKTLKEVCFLHLICRSSIYAWTVFMVSKFQCTTRSIGPPDKAVSFTERCIKKILDSIKKVRKCLNRTIH